MACSSATGTSIGMSCALLPSTGAGREMASTVSLRGTGLVHLRSSKLVLGGSLSRTQFRGRWIASSAASSSMTIQAKQNDGSFKVDTLGEVAIKGGRLCYGPLLDPALQRSAGWGVRLGQERRPARLSTVCAGRGAPASQAGEGKANFRSYPNRKSNKSIRDQKKRDLVEAYKEKREEYKKICNDRTASMEVRYEASIKLQKLPRSSSKTRLKNRCFLTGRARSYYRDVGLARMTFRELAHAGVLPGLTKASW